MKYLTYILIILILSACQNGDKIAERKIASPLPSAQTISGKDTILNKAHTKKEKSTKRTISVRGYIEVPPGNLAGVSVFYGGFVKDVKMHLGQNVEKGEVLFTLQNPDYIEMQQAYLEVKERLSYLEADYLRQKELAKENITSAKKFKKAESDYKIALVRHKGLQEKLKLMNLSIEEVEKGNMKSTIPIYAPIHGSITAIEIQKSAYLDAKEIAMEITNTDHIHLELEVFEKDLIHIKEGQDITFRIPESGNRTFMAEVYLVGKSIDLQKRTTKIHGHLHEEHEIHFIPGMFVEAEIEINSDTKNESLL